MTTQHPPNDHPLARPPLRQGPGVPRRFGVGGLMILITMVAVLFSLLQSLGAPAFAFVMVTVMLVGVAAGQVLLFGGKRPCETSLLVGACLYPPLFLYALWGVFVWPGVAGMAIVLPWLMVVGAGLGYFVRLLIMGVFIIMPQYGKDPEEPDPPSLQLRPLTEADIDTLIRWTESRRLFEYWSGMTFSYPLDRKQMLDHLGDTEDEQPRRRMFMATSPSTQLPVACVELDQIDRDTHSAFATRALIGPNESDRSLLSIALLSTMMDVAFTEMQLHCVHTLVPIEDSITRDCYKEVGFHEEGVLNDGADANDRYPPMWRLRMVDVDRVRLS